VKQSILVVGAGVVGCSLAREFALRGCQVTLLDAAEAGTGTTAASYSWINAYAKEPQSYAELNDLGLRAHERWSAEYLERGWFHRTGNIKVAHGTQQMEDLEKQVTRLRGRGYPAELLPVSSITGMEPALDLSNALGGAYFSGEGWVDTNLMCSALVDDAVRSGARFLPYHRVSELTETGIIVSNESGLDEWFGADTIILAAGNGIRPLTAALGVKFPTLPVAMETSYDQAAPSEHPTVGMICTTTPVTGAPKHMVHSDSVSMRPSPNGGVTLTDHPTASSWDAASPGLWQAPQALLERARKLCPALDFAEISTVTVGHRVLPSDGLTIADWLDPAHRYYAVATHSGVTLAPHLAETTAAEVLTGIRHSSLADFGLQRFAFQN
jgi:D-hydroxyproline dehydrogenase subunit beta